MKGLVGYIFGGIVVILLGFVDELLKGLDTLSYISERLVPILQVVSLLVIIVVGAKKWRKHNKS